MRKINYIPFESTDKELRENYLKAFESFLDNKWYILGKEVEKFEHAWAEYCSTRFAVGVGNGYDALFIALKALGIGNGDEVIVPAHTFAATALAVLNLGAKPVLVDADEQTFNINVNQVKREITSNTKALIAVHLYGNPCDMEALINICSEHEIDLIEDNAQAQGATFNGQKTGSFGVVSTTSFYPIKNLGAMGDAGAINTSSDKLFEKIKLLRSYGSPDKHVFEYCGVNSRLDELQSALLNVKLPFLDQWNKERNNINLLYREALNDIDEIQLCSQPGNIESANHIFPILSKKRDELRSFLRENGIQTLCHYPLPYHLEKAFDSLNYKKGDFPVTEKICSRVISLPIFPGLTSDDVKYIADKIRQFFRG